jgi:hypothetical protein
LLFPAITPNGAVAFALILILGAIATISWPGLALIALLCCAFALAQARTRTITALRRSLIVVLPLVLFMLIVWVGVVGRAPAEIAAGAVGSRSAALLYVAKVCTRLFLIVFTIQAIAAAFAQTTPLSFMMALRLPLALKRLLVLTLSLTETFRHAVDRAHSALVSGGVLTRQLSLRNVANGWVLVQTVWLTAITIVIGRLRDKWPIEDTLGRLDNVLQHGTVRAFGRSDVLWLPLALIASVIAVGMR